MCAAHGERGVVEISLEVSVSLLCSFVWPRGSLERVTLAVLSVASFVHWAIVRSFDWLVEIGDW